MYSDCCSEVRLLQIYTILLRFELDTILGRVKANEVILWLRDDVVVFCM